VLAVSDDVDSGQTNAARVTWSALFVSEPLVVVASQPYHESDGQPPRSGLQSAEMNALDRLRATDWTGKPEATICSQLIMPVLTLLGYGEHTLHKVKEQQVYKLVDPTISKGSRRIRLDYEPRVYEEGLWVMEAKGSDANGVSQTLGQVRDYAIHPEVRASLMVTVDAGGFRVFDPWDLHWDEPILEVGLNEVADRIEDLRAVLGVDRVGDVVRRRHLDHLRRALAASIEWEVVEDAEREFAELIKEVRANIDSRRLELHREAMREGEQLHDRVLRESGVWGVVQQHNEPWIGSLNGARDFANAVLYQEERQRPTQIGVVRRAVEAVYEERCRDGVELYRPLWWLNIVVLGGCLELRGNPGCEPYATDIARQKVRDVLLGFPDDPAAAASWRLQRVATQFFVRAAALGPLDELSRTARSSLSAEDQIRYRFEPSWFFAYAVRMSVIGMLSKIDPWTAEEIDKQEAVFAELLRRTRPPVGEWMGPATDPWLESWKSVDPLLMCGLAALSAFPTGDEFLADEDLRAIILDAAASKEEILRRTAVPLVERLGLAK
jgi:hypothetical protein